MNSRTANNILLFLLLTAVLLVLLVLGSCSNESPTIPPTFRVGTIEGIVTSMGEPVRCDIRVNAVSDDNFIQGIERAKTDSTGWYRMDLPTGLYEIAFDSFGNDSRFNVEEAIQIQPGRQRHDLNLSRVKMRIGMPEELQGEPSRVEMDNDRDFAWAVGDSVAPGWMEFVFPAVGPGEYTTKFNYPDGQQIFFPGTLDREDAGIFTVPADQEATYELDLRGSFASISGQVLTGCEGREFLQPDVIAFAVEDRTFAIARCDAEGFFRMNFFILEPVRLAVDLRYIDRWIGGDSFATAQVFDLQPGSRFTDVGLVSSGFQMTLNGPGHLINHDPIYTLIDEAGDEFRVSQSWVNPLVVCNLPPGRYYLYADGQCNNEVWMPQWYGGSAVQDEAVSIDLEPGEFKELEMDLVEGGRIRGDLFNSDGTRPWAVTVNLADSTGATFCSSMPWFLAGEFELRGLADGEYHMFTIWQNSAWIYPGTYEFDEAQTITVTDHQVVDGITWGLPGIIDPEGP